MENTKKIKFITDSAGDLPKEFIKEKNIDILAFHVYLKHHDGKTEEYSDSIDIQSDEVFDFMLANKGAVSTSQVTVFEMEEYFRSLAEKNEYDTYLFPCISSVGSPTYNNVHMALKNLKEEGIELDVRMVDSMTYSVCYYYALKEGIKAYENGADVDEIVRIMDECCKSTNVFLVNDTLEYLKRGGRITGMSAALGTMLDIKPILTVQEGLVGAHEKVRGIKKAMHRIIDLVKDATCDGDYRYMILYSTKADYYNDFVELTKESFPGAEINEHQVGCTIGIHIGPGLVGLMFQKKPQ
ncbi:MAG: DegV family protein [Clostridia bacterium]|nr:DegV family protein [Clostridia bacterium]